MDFRKIIFAALAVILFTAPAYADRDDRRGHDRHHKRKRHHTVIVRPNVISIWPGYHHSYYPSHRPRHTRHPNEVSMTCANGKEVTIRAAGLSIYDMLNKAENYCARQHGNLYRIDILSGNRYCREYQTRTTIGGQRERSYGTACLQPDGSWEIMN
ncbi:MAG TPA: hypothetical protein PKW15_05555 [Alphaproteobacteria bacterium]|nr:hypothetical protein [Rhodospirillaceae bacterium]HRJ12692.1 hypothetical protein [Alphaproteobacteria bacterium]